VNVILFILYYLLLYLFILDIIHTVGPQGEKPDKLKECYENSLILAKENCLRTIAFPCISTGIYGYPQRPAAKVAISTVKKFLLDNKDIVRLHMHLTNYYFSIYNQKYTSNFYYNFSGGQSHLLLISGH